MKQLQPYRRFETYLIPELIAQEYVFLVCQFYIRARNEVEAGKTPVLFTAYHQFDEALIHYESVQQKGDHCASIIDLTKNSCLSDMMDLCTGRKEETPFLSQLKDPEYVDQYIQRFYTKRLTAWLTKEKERWDVSAFHIPEFSLITVMGEPMIKVQYGDGVVIVSLEELERE